MDEEMLISPADFGGEEPAEHPAAPGEETAGAALPPAEEAAMPPAAESAPAGEHAPAETAAEEPAGTLPAAPALDGRQAEILRFAREYPGVGPGDIAPEILMKWNAGQGTLCDLYAAGDRPRLLEENRKLKEQLAAYEQQEKNRQTETGTRASAGNAEAMSELDRIWYEGN